MFLDIETEISAPAIEDDQDTVLMTLETICYKLMEKTKRKRTSSKKLQRCGKKIHIDKSPLLPSRGNAPPTHAQAPIPLSTDLTLQDMMIPNIEALKYQCSRTLMDKIQQLPKPGETFLLPTFDKNVLLHYIVKTNMHINTVVIITLPYLQDTNYLRTRQHTLVYTQLQE